MRRHANESLKNFNYKYYNATYTTRFQRRRVKNRGYIQTDLEDIIPVFVLQDNGVHKNENFKTFSSPEPTILLVCGRDRELWPGPTPEVRVSHKI